MEKGLKIYYHALAHSMTPSTTFAQAREATLKAATDLYGADSAEVAKVRESWSAVIRPETRGGAQRPPRGFTVAGATTGP